jgi:hypothetical protein
VAHADGEHPDDDLVLAGLLERDLLDARRLSRRVEQDGPVHRTILRAEARRGAAAPLLSSAQD